MSVLEGIRVIDLTTGIAGPIVGMFLADFGADVVKVEEPSGDPARTLAGFATWNRGKKSVVVDPFDPAARQWLSRQIAGADVLLVRSADQLVDVGLDADELLRSHPRLVVAMMPPYLPGFAPWAGGHESAGLLMAAGGMSARQTSVSGEPVDSVYPTILYAHGAWATTCVVSALLERERSGHGQRVTVSGINALQQLAGGSFVIDPDSDDVFTATGAGGRHPLYTRMLAGDGRWFGCGALGAKFELAALDVFGLRSMLDDPRLDGRVSRLVAPENIEWAQQQIAAAALTRPAADWIARLDAVGIPSAALAERDAWLDHPQIRAIGMRVEVDDPQRGPVVMPGIPMHLSASPGAVAGPAPRLGEHNATVPEWIAPPNPVERPALRPGPLFGYRILVNGTFVAVPHCGSLLAQLGAEVIKIEPPDGDPFRPQGYGVNRGAKSLSIDLKSSAGQAAFHRAVAGADAVVDGLRPGVAQQLNVDYEALHSVNPEIVTTTLSAFGEGGELSQKSGVDMVIQGMSGMMTAQGGADDPVINTIAIVDMATGALSALATTLALLHKARSGRGQRVWVALASTAAYLQSGEITSFADRPSPVVGGQDFRGPGPYERIYSVADGWIRVDAGPGVDPATALAAADIGIDTAPAADEAVFMIAKVLAQLSVEQATVALNGAGLAAVEVRRVSAVIRDPRLVESEFIHVNNSGDGRVIVAPGRPASFSRSVRFGPLLPPGAGEHSTEVLLSAGLSQQEIDRLVADGVVRQGVALTGGLAPTYR